MAAEAAGILPAVERKKMNEAAQQESSLSCSPACSREKMWVKPHSRKTVCPVFQSAAGKEKNMAKSYVWETPEEMDLALAKRVRNIRRRRSISQEKLSRMSGVSLGSIKRFETSGQISLVSLTKISVALGCGDEIRNLFVQVPYQNIEEVIRENR